MTPVFNKIGTIAGARISPKRLVRYGNNLHCVIEEGPIDWFYWRVGHVTILLPVWRFWPFGVIKTVGNGTMVMSPVVGHVPGRGSKGARTGGHGVARVDSDHAECEGVLFSTPSFFFL